MSPQTINQAAEVHATAAPSPWPRPEYPAAANRHVQKWIDAVVAVCKPDRLYWFEGSMKGRTMYVVPFVMGPIGSPLAKVGVQVTDSLYVAVSMGVMTRMGNVAWEQLGSSDEWTRCIHGLGDVNPERRFVCHFPLDNAIWSFGSGYGGN